VRNEIFQLAYHGGGGFPINALYDLPVHERKHYLKLLVNQKQSEEKGINSNKKTITPSKQNSEELNKMWVKK